MSPEGGKVQKRLKGENPSKQKAQEKGNIKKFGKNFFSKIVKDAR